MQTRKALSVLSATVLGLAISSHGLPAKALTLKPLYDTVATKHLPPGKYYYAYIDYLGEDAALKINCDGSVWVRWDRLEKLVDIYKNSPATNDILLMRLILKQRGHIRTLSDFMQFKVEHSDANYQLCRRHSKPIK